MSLVFILSLLFFFLPQSSTMAAFASGFDGGQTDCVEFAMCNGLSVCTVLTERD